MTQSVLAARASARRRLLGQVLIALGVAAWVPYAVMTYGLQQEVSPAPYLVAHLCGVLPGSLLVRWRRSIVPVLRHRGEL